MVTSFFKAYRNTHTGALTTSDAALKDSKCLSTLFLVRSGYIVFSKGAKVSGPKSGLEGSIVTCSEAGAYNGIRTRKPIFSFHLLL